MEIDGFFVEIFEQRGRNLREFGLGVTVGRGWISVDRAEISLTKNRRVAHAPGLRQADESVVHGEVAVRMILAHGVQNAAMHGLQSVAHIGQRAADDDRHRIVEIRLAHLLFDIDGMNVAGARTLSVASGRRS